MKIVTYNIQYGLGRDGRYDLARIAGEVADADVIALQEVERFWQRSGTIDEPAVIAGLLPDHHWIFGANLDMDASFRDERGALVNRRRQFGNMILSRFPIVSSRNFPLPKFATLSQHAIQRGLLEAVIDPGNGPIRFYSTHLCHLSAGTRLPQVDFIKEVLARAPSDGGAWSGGHPDPDAGWTEGEMPPMPREIVLLGDMNCSPESLEYERFTGPVSPQYGRLINRNGLIDAWVVAGNDEASGSTYPGEGRIDHCFVSTWMAERIRDVRVDTGAEGSDHWPVWVEMD